jgi:hypothetical protein
MKTFLLLLLMLLAAQIRNGLAKTSSSSAHFQIQHMEPSMATLDLVY